MLDLAQLEMLIWSYNQGTKFSYTLIQYLHHKEAEVSLILSYKITEEDGFCAADSQKLSLFFYNTCASVVHLWNKKNYFLPLKRWKIH